MLPWRSRGIDARPAVGTTEAEAKIVANIFSLGFLVLIMPIRSPKPIPIVKASYSSCLGVLSSLEALRFTQVLTLNPKPLNP